MPSPFHCPCKGGFRTGVANLCVGCLPQVGQGVEKRAADQAGEGDQNGIGRAKNFNLWHTRQKASPTDLERNREPECITVL